jgi:hypothetical protein
MGRNGEQLIFSAVGDILASGFKETKKQASSWSPLLAQQT